MAVGWYRSWPLPATRRGIRRAAFYLHAASSDLGRRHDGLWGVYWFKRGFGGRLQRRAGTWERALS